MRFVCIIALVQIASCISLLTPSDITSDHKMLRPEASQVLKSFWSFGALPLNLRGGEKKNKFCNDSEQFGGQNFRIDQLFEKLKDFCIGIYPRKIFEYSSLVSKTALPLAVSFELRNINDKAGKLVDQASGLNNSLNRLVLTLQVSFGFICLLLGYVFLFKRP